MRRLSLLAMKRRKKHKKSKGNEKVVTLSNETKHKKKSGFKNTKSMRRLRKQRKGNRELGKDVQGIVDNELNVSDYDDDYTPLSLLLSKKAKKQDFDSSSSVKEICETDISTELGKDVSDYDDDYTLFSLQHSKKAKKQDFGSSSSVKKICEADISTELGKGCEKTGKVIEICDTSEVREVFQRKLPTISGKALDPEFKEIEDEEKGMETAIGSEDSELKENDDSIQKQENDTAKKEVKKSTDEASGVGKYKYKLRRSGRLSNKVLSRFTNITADPICLETDESVKIDYPAIQQLLGVPCGEVTIESMSKLKARDDSVKVWRNKYPRNFVAPTELVSNIENAEDEDCFNFRMDFLMCFFAVMMECHGEGRCKEIFLDKLAGETDFSNINWCAYIKDSMRGCKKRWKRNDRSVPFSGHLAILTLLYVKSVECKGIKTDKKMNPISFSNMSRLKERQKWEIENGGFEKGKYKRLTKLIEDEDEEDSGYSVVDEIEGLEKLLDVIHKQKKLIDNKLGRLLEKHPDREEVLYGDDENTNTEKHSDTVGGYDSSASENKEEEEETRDKDVNADIVNGEEKEDNAGMINEEEKGVGELHESDTISLRQGDLEKGHNRHYTDKNPEIIEEMSDEEQGKHRITEQENTTENVYDGPPLQSKDCDNETKQIEERNLEKMVDGNESCVSGERDEGVLEKKRDQVIKAMEEKRRNTMREIGLAMVSKSPYKIRGMDITEAITKEEELVCEYLFKEDGMMYKLYGKKKRKLETYDESKLGKEDDSKGKGKVGTYDESEIVYRNNSNLELEKFRFKTLKEDTKVFNKVIDAWGDVLNFEEKYRSPTSPYRLFCDTDLIFDWMLKDKETDWPKRMERFILNMNRAVCWNTSLIDLRAIDMVFLPMLENDHYYLIVFELKHPSISVIDNLSDAYPLIQTEALNSPKRQDGVKRVRFGVIERSMAEIESQNETTSVQNVWGSDLGTFRTEDGWLNSGLILHNRES
ncbi:hypothetical protein L1987_80757 [Smallanthus sonchifolius]|uniref:Uncharacterized protein n=1 Tax=Smallanthus sonchifolius TaxID=185202 RepID=A0ACB8YNM9_9ASTR|nr:hypothetical protein L1987_80757 [Smallanthus sonchifolius]